MIDAVATDTRAHAARPGALFVALQGRALRRPRPRRAAAAQAAPPPRWCRARRRRRRCRRCSSPTPSARSAAFAAGHAARPRRAKVVAHHRQQRQDQREDAGRWRSWRAPAAPTPTRQPQQRDRPAAGGARRARGRAVRRLRDGRRQAGRHRLPHRDRAAGRRRWSTTSRPRTWSAWAACSASPRPRARSTTRCRDDGVAVINADDAFAPYFAERAHGRRLIRFGLEASADVHRARHRARRRRLALRAASRRRARPTSTLRACRAATTCCNALAAASLALGAGVDARRRSPPGSTPREPVAGRLVAHRLRNGAVLIDDSYNANPGSLAAAIDTLAREPRRRSAGWCSATCANSAPMPKRCTPKPARRAQGRRHRAAVRAGPAERARGAAPSATAPRISTAHDALVAGAARAACATGVRVLVKGRAAARWTRSSTALLRDAEEGRPHAA